MQDANLDELNEWAPKMLAKLQTLPELRDVATDQQTGGTTLHSDDRPRPAARFGIQPQLIDDTLYDAFGQRQVTQYFTQLNSYHVILEVLPALQAPDRDARQALRELAEHGRPVPLSHLRQMDDMNRTSFAVDQPPEPVPGGDHLSFNLAPGVALGQAVDSDSTRPRRRSARRRR